MAQEGLQLSECTESREVSLPASLLISAPRAEVASWQAPTGLGPQKCLVWLSRVFSGNWGQRLKMERFQILKMSNALLLFGKWEASGGVEPTVPLGDNYQALRPASQSQNDSRLQLASVSRLLAVGSPRSPLGSFILFA